MKLLDNVSYSKVTHFEVMNLLTEFCYKKQVDIEMLGFHIRLICYRFICLFNSLSFWLVNVIVSEIMNSVEMFDVLLQLSCEWNNCLRIEILSWHVLTYPLPSITTSIVTRDHVGYWSKQFGIMCIQLGGQTTQTMLFLQGQHTAKLNNWMFRDRIFQGPRSITLCLNLDDCYSINFSPNDQSVPVNICLYPQQHIIISVFGT